MRYDQQEIDEIAAQAKAELQEELHRERVEAIKQQLRERAARPFWKRLFPFNINVSRSA